LARALRGGRGLRLGLATDGDADRIAALDEHGRLLDDGEVAGLLLEHLARSGRLESGVALTLGCSSRLDRIAAAHGLVTSRHPVGFKYLAPRLLRGHAELAVDQAGGIAFGPFAMDKDGMHAAALLVELVASRRQGLAALVAGLDREYGRTAMRRAVLPIAPKLERALERLTVDPPSRLGDTRVLRCDCRDGLRLGLPDGFVLLRASGTEPLLRIHAEAARPAAALKRIDAARRLIARAAR
jgi:phosphomannomutase